MDSNTKIIILVLILVLIKIFAPTIDYFEHTTPESEQCTTIRVNPKPAKCEKYSCPPGQKLVVNQCWEEKKECVSPNTINNSSFKIYNHTFKVYLQKIDNNFVFTSDKKLATLFNIDSTNNLKYLNLYVNFNIPGNSNLKPPHSIYKWILYLNSKKDSGELIKYDGKNITSIYFNNSKIMLILNKDSTLEFLPIGDKKPLDSDGNFIPVF